MQKRLCLITGASAGIGAELARVYAAHGWDLALVARRDDRLRALADELAAAHGTQAQAIRDDLRDPAAPERILRAVEARGRPLDGLANNAGYGGADGLLTSDWRAHADFIEAMVAAPVRLAALAAPGMKARGYGRILNVASIAGMVPPARGQSLYGAAKAFMIEASRALHLEMAGTGVHVTALCPGLTRTEFHDVARMDAVASGTPRWMWQDAPTVAESGYRACEANLAIRIPGLHNKAAVALFRALPQDWGMALMHGATRRLERG